ncbi:MAG: hypothetical protein F9K30_10880 [Dechloromonas sp.]|nr:MAG: hypothetical protein F9K30_10880 [Dechloromonas sp.]
MTTATPLSEAQELVLRLMERTSVNNLSGPKIVSELRTNTSLWRSAYFTSIGIEHTADGAWQFNAARQDLISLRDLPKDFLQLDTLLLLPVPGAQDDLAALASGWGADIIQWVALPEAGRVMGGRRSVMEYSSCPDKVILYVWWD